MRHRAPRGEKPTAKLVVRKETVRNLRTLSEDELRGAGGWKQPPPPPRPSCPEFC